MGKMREEDGRREYIHCMDRNEREELKVEDIEHTIKWICEMEGEEMFLLAELHPHYTENSSHSPLTL
jgi:hypothetical protein